MPAFYPWDEVSLGLVMKVSPLYVPYWEDAFHALAEKQLTTLAQESEVHTMQPGKILVEYDSSLKHAAERIIKYALANKMDAIVVSTHARRGLSRFFLG